MNDDDHIIDLHDIADYAVPIEIKYSLQGEGHSCYILIEKKHLRGKVVSQIRGYKLGRYLILDLEPDHVKELLERAERAKVDATDLGKSGAEE